jgi:hypothetical protein
MIRTRSRTPRRGVVAPLEFVLILPILLALGFAIHRLGSQGSTRVQTAAEVRANVLPGFEDSHGAKISRPKGLPGQTVQSSSP